MRGSIVQQLKDEKRKMLAMAILATIDDRTLRDIGIPPSLMSEVEYTRNDDDWIGMSAAGYCMFLTNTPMQEQDRYVSGQILGVGSSCVIQRYILTKRIIDDQDVLTKPTIFFELWNKFNDQDWPGSLSPAAFDDEAALVVDYVEKYNALVTDNTLAIYKGGVNDDETANTDPYWMQIGKNVAGAISNLFRF